MQRIAAALLKRRLDGKEEAACGLEVDQRHGPKHGLPRRWDGEPIAPAGIERRACSSSRPMACCYGWLARPDGMGWDATGATEQPEPETESVWGRSKR